MSTAFIDPHVPGMPHLNAICPRCHTGHEVTHDMLARAHPIYKDRDQHINRGLWCALCSCNRYVEENVAAAYRLIGEEATKWELLHAAFHASQDIVVRNYLSYEVWGCDAQTAERNEPTLLKVKGLAKTRD